MVRVIEGKIVEKWFEGQQKLLRVSLGKITVTGCMKSTCTAVWRNFRGNQLE